LAIQLEQLGNDLSRDEAEISYSLLDLHKQISDVASDLHLSSRRLHPSSVDRVGLLPAMRSLHNEVRRQNGVAVECSSDNVPDLIPHDVSLCLFRIAEEAMNNALKHSGSSEIRVELAGDSGDIRLRISDSGRGYEPGSIENGEGLGFLSMRERLGW